jgi:hypothetical protein
MEKHTFFHYGFPPDYAEAKVVLARNCAQLVVACLHERSAIRASRMVPVARLTDVEYAQ